MMWNWCNANLQRGVIQVDKTVLGDPAPQPWSFTLSSGSPGCLLPTGADMTATTSTGASGSALFSDLPLYAPTDAAPTCHYTLSETAQIGWLLDTTSSDPMTGLTVAAGVTTTVAITNRQQPLSVLVAKQLNTPGSARITDVVSFTIQVTNTGPGAIVSLPLTDTFDSNYLTYRGATPATYRRQ